MDKEMKKYLENIGFEIVDEKDDGKEIHLKSQYYNDGWMTEDLGIQILNRVMEDYEFTGFLPPWYVMKKKESREEIIDEIVKLCEENTTWDVIEKVCEWLVKNSKHIRQHFLDVGDVQVCVNGQIKRTGGIFLYSETDADDTIIDLNTWAYYEKKGQGDNFSKEELKELYEKLQDNE